MDFIRITNRETLGSHREERTLDRIELAFMALNTRGLDFRSFPPKRVQPLTEKQQGWVNFYAIVLEDAGRIRIVSSEVANAHRAMLFSKFLDDLAALPENATPQQIDALFN